jgi:serine/threonine-protein kinase
MGRVYKVDHLTLGRSYALKVLHSEVLQRDPRSADRFVREARAASRIRHPNIIDVFDFGYLRDGRPYFVMELLDSTSLGDHIDEHGSLEPNRALTIARQLVDALRAAHDAGVIHADVTPSNILVADSRVKLVDFGLAELSEAVQVDETATHVMGTPRYVAPERLLGRASSEACDQYSLGIVMFEMLSGVTPFNAPDLKSLCRQHIQDPPPSVLSPFAPLPPELDRMVARCLEKSPGHRFPNMGALAAELEEVAWLVGQEARRAAS